MFFNHSTYLYVVLFMVALLGTAIRFVPHNATDFLLIWVVAARSGMISVLTFAVLIEVFRRII